MRLLALSGQRSAALAQYEACRRALKEELDVEPAEETTRLYERIRDGSDLGVLGELRGLKAASRPSNLPAQLTPFVGREGVLAQIAERLEDPDCRLLTLVGPGGSGKTRLALEAAARQMDHYAHGVLFVPLAPLRAVESIVPTVAQALGLTFQGQEEPKAQLLAYLRGKHLLLVLDNYEHLLEGAPVTTEILREAPEVKILVTSRAGLHVAGEHRVPVEGMDVPDQTSDLWRISDVLDTSRPTRFARDASRPTRFARDASRYSALKLFLQSARRVQQDFALTGDNLADVVRICHLVEGMPLGILLAAAWIVLFTPAEIAAEIERGLDFLESDQRDAPERQRSLRAAFEHSWNLLTEREAFAALSVFRGGFTRQAAQEVADVSPRELLALADKSLLHRTSTERYEIHELLRQYAAQKLAELPDAERAVRDRHAAYYATDLERWAAELKGPRQQAALAEMDAEIEDARVAWEWAVEQGQVEWLARSMEGLGLFYEWRARYQEGKTAFRAAVEALAADVEALQTVSIEGLRAWVSALAWQGLFALRLGYADRSRECLSQGMDLLDCFPLANLDTRRERAFLLWVLGEVEYWSGDRREGRELYEQGLVLYRALDEPWGMANALFGLGEIAQSLGGFEEARQFAREVLSLRRVLGAPKGIADSLWRMGWVSQSMGSFEEAERLERESVAICREMGDRAALAEALYRLGSTLAWQGKFSEGQSLKEECLAICSDLGFRNPAAIISLAQMKEHLGQYEDARVYLQQGLDLAQKMDRPWAIGLSFLGFGTLALVEGKYVEAQRRLDESVAVFRASGQRSDVGWPLAFLAGAARGLGQLAQARKHLCEALAMAAEIRDAFTPLNALPMTALLLADLGRAERAVEVYALASRHPVVANSRFWEDVAGRHVAAVAATLPLDVVAAAQERGRARDLWATLEELLAELQE